MTTFEEIKNRRRFARSITIYPDRVAVFNFSNDGLFMKAYVPTLATRNRIARLVMGRKADVITSTEEPHEFLFAFEFGESQS
jgi:hypothetical protein